MIYFGGITGFFIIFIIIIEALFNNIFNQLAFIFGLILAILFFLMILIIDYIVFNELKFLVYGKKLGMPFSEISLLLLDIKLNASKEKEKFLIKVPFKKYCAIKKGICHRKIIYYGAKSCFFAYPFREPFKELMNKLKFGLEKIGFLVKVLTDDSFDDIFVCKLCKEILSTNFIVCEVSKINRNVMFEYGYAKGLGKQGLLILNESSENNLIRKGMFSDTDQFRYKDIKDVIENIKNTLISSKDLQLILAPNVIGDCINCNIQSNEKRVLILTPDIFFKIGNKSSYFVSLTNRIKKILSKMGFKVNFMREITEGHILCNYCKQIKRSNYVIAIYVSDDALNNELINSGLAFIIGFALALGKKILILQKKPTHRPMIDLKGAVRDFEDLDELNRIITDFITN